MIKEIIKAYHSTNQERVAFLALRYNLKAIKVVDKDSHFLKVVTSDSILKILHSKDMVDLLRPAGVYDGAYSRLNY